MSGKYYDVDVRKVDIGHIVVKAANQQEAMRKVQQGDYHAIKSEFWNSVQLTALSAQPAEVVPNRLRLADEEDETEETY